MDEPTKRSTLLYRALVFPFAIATAVGFLLKLSVYRARGGGRLDLPASRLVAAHLVPAHLAELKQVPTRASLRHWYRGAFGARPALLIPDADLQMLRRAHTLYVYSSDTLFFEPKGFAHLPLRNPFEELDAGSEFLFMGSRSGADYSYLCKPMPPEYIRTLPTQHGCTTLLHLRQVAVFPAETLEPRVWPKLASESTEGLSIGQKRFVVFRDPHFGRHGKPISWHCTVSAHCEETDAMENARDFSERYNVATCVAEVLRHYDLR